MSITWDDSNGAGGDVAPVPRPQPAPTPRPATNTSAVTVAGGLLQLALLAFGAFGVWTLYRDHTPAPTPNPATVDYKALGRDYAAALGPAYVAAWGDGAAALEAGKAIPEALDVVAKRWDADRTALFAGRVSPAFSRVVPESADPKTLTPEQRAALAKAWREFAAGLRGSK